MFRVVGYRDLRPIDWLSGKRMPLEPGAGHVCDRCGAEHAVVYEVDDTDTGKHYSVGSSCAKRQFGFDASKEARALVKKAREQDEVLIDARRQEEVERFVAVAAEELDRLVVPEAVADRDKYPGAVAWRVGDSMALATHGRTDEEAVKYATKGWYENRIVERRPPEWIRVELLLYPGRSRDKISMAWKAAMLLQQKFTGRFLS